MQMFTFIIQCLKENAVKICQLFHPAQIPPVWPSSQESGGRVTRMPWGPPYSPDHTLPRTVQLGSPCPQESQAAPLNSSWRERGKLLHKSQRFQPGNRKLPWSRNEVRPEREQQAGKHFESYLRFVVQLNTVPFSTILTAATDTTARHCFTHMLT